MGEPPTLRKRGCPNFRGYPLRALLTRFPILFEIRRPNNDHPRLLWRVLSFGQVKDTQPKHAHHRREHENRQVEIPPIVSVIVQISLSALTNNYDLSRSAVSLRRVNLPRM
jgi:hypothetical protein